MSGRSRQGGARTRFLAPRWTAELPDDRRSRPLDRAVLLLLARLGLRAGDVAQMRLVDLEWQTGTLRVSGKGRYQVRLPLPQEVGDAILNYLKCRPHLPACEQVFVRNIAPYRPMVGGDGISNVVKRAMKRAGVMTPVKRAMCCATRRRRKCCVKVFLSTGLLWSSGTEVSTRRPITLPQPHGVVTVAARRVRRHSPADVEALALSRLSQIAAAWHGRFTSIEINPLLVHPRGAAVAAIDALIVTHTDR